MFLRYDKMVKRKENSTASFTEIGRCKRKITIDLAIEKYLSMSFWDEIELFINMSEYTIKLLPLFRVVCKNLRKREREKGIHGREFVNLW